jgi:osmotically-inducible protein OsmY
MPEIPMSTITDCSPAFVAFETVDVDTATAATAIAKIRQAPYQALRRIECRCLNGVLTLSGRVPSYYLKQCAQELVGEVANVEHVNNELEVVPPPQWDLVPPGVWRKERARKHNS